MPHHLEPLHPPIWKDRVKYRYVGSSRLGEYDEKVVQFLDGIGAIRIFLHERAYDIFGEVVRGYSAIYVAEQDYEVYSMLWRAIWDVTHGPGTHTALSN